MIAHGIDGWMSDEELAWLAKEAAKAQVIVEIGSWKGKSTAALAEHTPGIVFAVDHFLGSAELVTGIMREAAKDPGCILRQCVENLKQFIDAGKVFIVEMGASPAAYVVGTIIGHRKADMVWIDGAHDELSVSDDIRNYLPMVRPGGLICGHDINEIGVENAVNQLIPDWEHGARSIWRYTVPSEKQEASSSTSPSAAAVG